MSSRLFNLFIICALTLLVSTVEARTKPGNESFHRATRQRDFDAVQRFVNSRRTIPLEEKEGFLKISGDIRTEASYRRQSTRKLPVPTLAQVLAGREVKSKKDIDAEVNLKFAYKCNRTEAFAKLFFDGTFGIDGSPKQPIRDEDGDIVQAFPEEMYGSSDSNDFLALKECWVSHIFYECEGIKSKVFAGRCNLEKIFKSRLQFNSRFNGIMLNHSHVFRPDWKVYGQAAAFVIDERANHYGYVGEVGTLDFFESKVDIIYNLICWKKKGLNRANKRDPRGAQFCNSQLWLAYNIPKWFPRDAKIYSSIIYNHAARKRPETFNTRQNIAWDVGALYGGSVEKQNDWTVEVQYQYVQAQSISDADMAGIGRGNFKRETFTADGRGATNFQGYKITTLYAITDNLTAECCYQESWQLKKKIGGTNHYNKASVEIIHSF